MPFTLAHPGAVVFVKNKRLNTTGLVLGAMAPDFMYFILFSPSSSFGHTLMGMILLNIPLCFLIYFLSERYLKPAFILNLPKGLSKYYVHLAGPHKRSMTDPIEKNMSFQEALIFAYSSMIGMFTHVFWDGFTHNTGYFVTRFSFLTKTFSLLGHQVHVFKIAQHGSTLVGFAIIFMFLYQLRKENLPYGVPIQNKLIYHILATLVALTVMALSYFVFKDHFPIGRLVVTLINGLFLGYLVSSIYFMREMRS